MADGPSVAPTAFFRATSQLQAVCAHTGHFLEKLGGRYDIANRPKNEQMSTLLMYPRPILKDLDEKSYGYGVLGFTIVSRLFTSKEPSRIYGDRMFFR